MFEKDYVIVDLETTGFSPKTNEIIEIGAIKVKDNKIVDKLDILVKPDVPVNYEITKLTGITNEMLKDAENIQDALKTFKEFAEDNTLVAHNARFDMNFLKNNYEKHLNETLDNDVLDTLKLAKTYVNVKDYKLGTLAKYFSVDYSNAHRAVNDCEITYHVYNGIEKMSKI